MRWFARVLILSVCVFAGGATAAVPAAATRPIVAVPSTQPTAVPFRLTDTNHLLIRLKINGKGPFNFIVDTGAPTMILRTSAAEKLGLKANGQKIATIDQLEIEGGLTLQRVKCLVETPYQIEGMNAIGASGVELDGLLGYTVLARFRMQIDLSKDVMVWTPTRFVPPPMQRTARGPATRATTRPSDPFDKSEANLESSGGLLKALGPLMKRIDPAPKPRGFIGIELQQLGNAVGVLKVLGDSPAELAGVRSGDRIGFVDDKPVGTIKDVQVAAAKLLIGQTLKLRVSRNDRPVEIKIVAGEGL